jgi:hypothetical protein
MIVLRLVLARVLVLGEEAGNGHVIPRSRAPGACASTSGRRDRHRKHVGHAIQTGSSASVHGAVMLGLTVSGRGELESRRLENRVVHHAAIRRCVRSGRAHAAGAAAPDLFELCRRDVGTIISGNGRPELLTARLIDSTKSLGVDDTRMVSDFGVDAKSIVGLGRALRSKCARLRKKNLVLAATWGCSD